MCSGEATSVQYFIDSKFRAPRYFYNFLKKVKIRFDASVRLFPNSSKTANPNLLKFWVMNPLGMQIVLGWTYFQIRPTVRRKKVCTLKASYGYCHFSSVFEINSLKCCSTSKHNTKNIRLSGIMTWVLSYEK